MHAMQVVGRPMWPQGQLYLQHLPHDRGAQWNTMALCGATATTRGIISLKKNKKRWHLTHRGNPIVEIRRSYDHIISTMGFHILVRWHLYIESGPEDWLFHQLVQSFSFQGMFCMLSLVWSERYLLTQWACLSCNYIFIGLYLIKKKVFRTWWKKITLSFIHILQMFFHRKQ